MDIKALKMTLIAYYLNNYWILYHSLKKIKIFSFRKKLEKRIREVVENVANQYSIDNIILIID